MRITKLLPVLVFACTSQAPGRSEDENSTSGASIQVTDHLSGCEGIASSTIPASGDYYMTTFGGGADTQPMSCGGTADGVGYYAASRQRYGCGSKLQVEANGKCIVLDALDYGPDECVEAAAGGPILDMSPAGAEYLWDVSSAGWSDHLKVTVTEVASSTPTGPCAATSSGGGGGGGTTGSGSDGSTSGSGTSGGGSDSSGGSTSSSTSCSSATLGFDVDAGTCVQASSNAEWYQCEDGLWYETDSTDDCTATYGWCYSPTLGESVPPASCVQSAASGTWFQCNGTEWVTPVDTSAESGPLGACTSWSPL